MTWSFSRIDVTCYADFYQNYIQQKEKEGNGWNEMGKFCHSIVEQVGRGDITTAEGHTLFKDNFFDCIEHPFPASPNWPNPEQSYYDKIEPWFAREKWWEEEVLTVEEHFVFTLPSGEEFQCYVDQIGMTPKGEIKIRDFKVAKKYTAKEVLKKVRQLHIYAYAYKFKYGVYPSLLEFQYFQNGTPPHIFKVNEKDVMATIEWAEKRITYIKSKIQLAETEKGHFMPDYTELAKGSARGYYCANICSFRNNCPFVDGYLFKDFNK